MFIKLNITRKEINRNWESCTSHIRKHDASNKMQHRHRRRWELMSKKQWLQVEQGKLCIHKNISLNMQK